MICHIDIESFSEINLKQVGVYRYAEHESTELLVVCFAFDDEPVCTWVPCEEESLPEKVTRALALYHEEEGGEFWTGLQVPFLLEDHVRSGGQLRAHNAEFERIMLNGGPGKKVGFPETPISQWVCTAAKAASMSLPRALEKVAKELSLPVQKSTEGRIVMLQLAKPRKHKEHTRWTPSNAPDKFVTLYAYCAVDVATERCVDQALPDLSSYEQKVWQLDQEINGTGIALDVPSIHNVLDLVKRYRTQLKRRCKKLTGLTPSQTAKLADWIREQGYPIQNMQAATIDAALGDEEMPPLVRKVLKLRRMHEMKAPDKYSAMLRAVNSDNRLRGMFLYAAAGTGRWAGRIVQLQNLYRGDVKDPEEVIEAYRERDLGLLKMLWKENPMKLFASTVRGMLVSELQGGGDLLGIDFSSIEGRVLAWEAGDERKLEIYRTHGLVYEDTAALMFKLPNDQASLEAMGEEYPENRFLGKTGELACGFQGGANAFMRMAKNYGRDIDARHAEVIVDTWRAVNKKTVRYWKKMENAAKAAVADKGKIYRAGEHILFRYAGDFLQMRLPSGRRISYYRPRLESNDRLTYMGIDTYTRQWCRVDTYGGRLTENATQAIARDLLAYALLNLRAKGFTIVGHVHDEVILDDYAHRLQEATDVMCQKPKWARDIPVKATGFAAKRYRKD